MALKKCRECGGVVSDAAKVCPHCGVKHPVGRGIGLFGLLFLGFFGFVMFNVVIRQGQNPGPAAVAAPAPPPTKTKWEIVAEMEPNAATEALKDDLLSVCQRVDSRYNHLRVELRSGALYCVHDFYNKYSLASGPLAPALQAYVGQWEAQLNRLKIRRVGVYGTGSYASGTWYEVPK